MSTQVQYRRGTTAENNAFTGALAEITVDTTAGTLRVHDGITAGGSNIATKSYVDAAIGSLSSSSISSGTSSVSVIATNGNVRTNVAGTTIQTISSTGVEIIGNLSVTGNASLSGNILGDRIQNGTTSFDIQSQNGNANITVAGTSNVAVFASTGVFVSGIASVTGNVTGGNLSVSTGTITGGNIVNANGNGVGNIGSSSIYFNTVFAKATSAQYADLAEKYLADTQYQPGTVLEIGGSAEVTATKSHASNKIAGVVSTNPAFIMNQQQQHDLAVEVALLGRVPCQVVGLIRRGDLLCSSHLTGIATKLNNDQYTPGCVIGKALQDYANDIPGTIEIMVGRL